MDWRNTCLVAAARANGIAKIQWAVRAVTIRNAGALRKAAHCPMKVDDRLSDRAFSDRVCFLPQPLVTRIGFARIG